jgi:cysteine desulfurase/selenocysteine lyase
MNYKKDFPIFKSNPELVYLDSAATAQKPQKVIEDTSYFSANNYANIHRGAYKLSLESTNLYEETRNIVSNFFDVSPDGCIFTKNGTEASNIFISGFVKKYLKKDDEVVISVLEHHALFVPLLKACKDSGAKLRVVHPKDKYSFTVEDFEKECSEKTKLIAFTHVSNVTGQILPIKEITLLAKKYDSYTLVDACQSAPHIPFLFNEFGVDSAYVTGHKFGAGGTGCLFLSDRLKNNIDPLLLGGNIIIDVTEENYELLPSPQCFETGTPAIENIVGLKSSIDYMNSIGGIKTIEKHEKELLKYVINEIKTKLPNWEIIGPTNHNERSGNISLYHKQIHHTDVVTILAKNNIAVRTGFHCANPYHHFLDIKGSIRASFWIYSTKEDIDKFIDQLVYVEKIFLK